MIDNASPKPVPGAPLPEISVPLLGGESRMLGQPGDGRDWQLLVVYRGLHCPLCKKYLKGLEAIAPKYHELGLDVLAVSADPVNKAQAFADEVGLTIPVGYDLTPAQMAALGLYISEPRSPQETDRPFAEPGLFVVNDAGHVQIVDISNAPFARPDLESLLGGIGFVRENAYPIRGTLAA